MAADKILVIEGGRLAETGRHEELLALNGVYRRLYDTQFRRVAEDGEQGQTAIREAGKADDSLLTSLSKPVYNAYKYHLRP